MKGFRNEDRAPERRGDFVRVSSQGIPRFLRLGILTARKRKRRRFFILGQDLNQWKKTNRWTADPGMAASSSSSSCCSWGEMESWFKSSWAAIKESGSIKAGCGGGGGGGGGGSEGATTKKPGNEYLSNRVIPSSIADETHLSWLVSQFDLGPGLGPGAGVDPVQRVTSRAWHCPCPWSVCNALDSVQIRIRIRTTGTPN